MKALPFLLFLPFLQSCCSWLGTPDCAQGPNDSGRDLLASTLGESLFHGITKNGDTLYNYFEFSENLERTVVYVELFPESELVYFFFDGTILDSLYIEFSYMDTDCCGTEVRIDSLDFLNKSVAEVPNVENREAYCFTVTE